MPPAHPQPALSPFSVPLAHCVPLQQRSPATAFCLDAARCVPFKPVTSPLRDHSRYLPRRRRTVSRVTYKNPRHRQTFALLSFDFSAKRDFICIVSLDGLHCADTHSLSFNMTRKRRSLSFALLPSFLQFGTTPASPAPPTPEPQPPRATTPGPFMSLRRMPSALAIFQPTLPQPVQRHPNNSRIDPDSISLAAPFPNLSPPPDYLLDEDPFANLATPPRRGHRSMTSALNPPTLSQNSQSTQRSLLSATRPDSVSSTTTITSTSSSTSNASSSRDGSLQNRVARTMSSGHANVLPAYLRPAFTHRPSLPSLNFLTQKSITIPIPKVRKGKVGARLPSEPWNTDGGNNGGGNVVSDSSAPAQSTDYIGPAPSDPSTDDTPDFTHNLDFEVDSDCSSDLLLDLYNELESDSGSSTQSHSYKISPPQALGRFQTSRSIDGHESGPFIASSPSSPPPLTRSTSSNSSSSSGMTSTGPRTPWSSVDETIFFPKQVSYLPPLDDDQDSYAEVVFPHAANSLEQVVVYNRDGANPDSPNLTPRPMTFSSHDLNRMDKSQEPYEPSTSAGTIRSPLRDRVNKSRSGELEPRGTDNSQTEMTDGSGWNGHRSNGGGYAGSSNFHTGNASRSTGNGGGHGNSPRSGRGNGQDGDDRKRPGTGQSAFSTPTDAEESAQEEEDEPSTDDYGQASPMRLNSPSRSRSSSQPSSQDDVPLAQRIPTALDAQRNIQRQVRDERDRRRKNRAALRQHQRELSQPSQTAGPVVVAMDVPNTSRSQSTSLHASPSTQRPRNKVLPSNLVDSTSFADLTKRLLKVQDTTAQHFHHDKPLPAQPTTTKTLYPFPRFLDHDSQKEQQPFPQEEGHESRARHARSFHKSSSRDTPDGSSTRSSQNTDNRRHLNSGGLFSFERLIKSHRTNDEAERSESSNLRPSTSSGRLNTGMGRSSTTIARPSGSGNRLGRSHTASVGRPSTSSGIPFSNGGKPSPGEDQTPSRASADMISRTTHRPPVPPLPIMDATNSVVQPSSVLQTQQRVFIGDMQSFNMIDVGPSTSAGDVLRAVEERGSLKQYAGNDTWMLWEMAQDFGMERPIRSYELLSDVSATWNKDKMLNTFQLRMSPLAPILSRSAIPTSSPKHSGYVDWEVKRGKWSKRWLELRENSLWLSKRETGKSELLCSLSTFDAYFVTRPYKSPKPFVFAVKSTDNLSLFENAADYLHIFSCNQKDGDKWMEKILLARSYVLQQERTILFTGSSSPGAATGTNQLHRKATSAYRPIQPLVQLSLPVFEPGSLLGQS